MSKRSEKTRTAKFSIGSEGFSIHTFEISRRLTRREYKRTKKFLYDKVGRTYKAVGESNTKIHVSTAFAGNGVRTIRLFHYSDASYDSYYLVMVINPRKLLEPDSSYLGIFEAKKRNVRELVEKFEKLFQCTEIESDLGGYQFSRIDLCVNIYCDTNKILRELVRVLRKLPTPAKYERQYRKSKNKQEGARYNKHYIKFCCGTHNLVIYDKTYQIEANGIKAEYEKLPNGVLRVEMCCLRTYLKKFEKEEELETAEDFLWYMVQNSGEILTDKISCCFPHWRYYQVEHLKEKIKNSHYPADRKEKMKTLVEKMQRKQSFETAFEDMGLTKKREGNSWIALRNLGSAPFRSGRISVRAS